MRTAFTAEQLADPHVADAERQLRTCIHCGFCTATCPTYTLLGDERDSPRAVMHGFLNVFLAAVFHHNGLTERDTIDLLNARTLDDVVMDDETFAWREYVVTVNEVSTIRRRHAVAFGSCSFTDPVDDLTELGLLT